VTRATAPSNMLFGFLTMVELPSVGHCGGLLIVSNIGRPLEFHCTAPTPRNRAQEIMYGATYQSFLYAEQIGMALVDKAKSKPALFVTDLADVLPITEMIDQPLILVENQNVEEPFDGRGLKQFQINEQKIYAVNTKADQLEAVQAQAEMFARTLPFEEPFERICSAIEEANQVLRAAA